MAGFVWNTNHRMWKIVPPFTDSWDVLKAYVVDPSAYVYWSTPRFQDEISVGDVAFIFRTVDMPGIVACGRVEELPRQLAPATVDQFAHPRSLTPPGWDEMVAPSAWKTGIRIERTFWDDPVGTALQPTHGAVARLAADVLQRIEDEIRQR